MTTKYVSTTRGDDSTGDGSAAAPWKTIGKAVGASPAFTLDSANPNFLYVEPGVYRESVTLGVAPTSSGPLSIIGDGDGAGFAAGGYATPKAGLVDWRCWTDDSTVITSGSCLKATSVNYVTVAGVKMIGGQPGTSPGGCVDMVTCTNWTLSACQFIGSYLNGGVVVRASASAAQVINLVVDRCIFFSVAVSQPCLRLECVAFNATEWSLGATVKNSLFGGAGYGVQAYGPTGGGNGGGGIAVQSCSFIGVTRAIDFYNARTATITSAKALTAYGCVMVGGGLYAGAAATVVENGNEIFGTVAYSNVTPGANSKAADCPSFDFGDWLQTGLAPNPLGQPSYVGTISGFGSYGTVPANDLTGRNRPEGAGSTLASAGCLERHDTGAANAVYQDTGSTVCLALVGPSSQERPVLVDPTATTLTVKVRWDGNHGDANKPRAVLIAEPEIGVAGQVVTATSTGGTGSTPNAYETLTFASFTPTTRGAVMLRLVSRSAAGNGVAYFDSIGL